ncbi:hypothetical protein BGZ50_004769 [Haplosporangium sp. Z 11]|nr:hypothetical protein BGZ50_004769 [Haplosporangium sp. Z 11]
MSATTRMTRMRALLAQHSSRQNVFMAASMRAPIRHSLGRTAAVTSQRTTQVSDSDHPWKLTMIPYTFRMHEYPDSKLAFPLRIPSEDGSPARLLGLGVRKITFLKVQVYVVGLYAKESDLDDHNSRFRAMPEVQKFQRTEKASADIAFRAMVQTPIELILRIAPVRSTNGPHLRDGFTRSLNQAAKDQKLSAPDNEEAMQGILEFKNLFPKGKIEAGQALLFKKSPDGTLTVQLGNEVLGSTRNQWVIETFFFSYLQGDNPISEKARDSIAEGIQNLLLQ